MKKLSILILLLFTTSLVFSQVGINTTTPKAQLEIKSSSQVTPANTDGILIPKIDTFPTTNPTADQQGMMVYLTTAVSNNPPGFYFWDNSITSWKQVGSSQWTTNANNISNNNSGNVGVGTGALSPYSLFTVKENGIGITQEDETGASKIGFYTIPSAAYIQTHSNTDMSFSTNNGISQMVLQKGTGNFGIGVTGPTEKLEVNGKTKTTNLQLTFGAGLGKILTSDATGTASWITPTYSSIQYFDENRSIASPNATIPVHQWTPLAVQPNVDLSISPKGTGALTVDVADNLASGGNKRGDYAVDLQRIRNNATQVASGDYATILGGSNNTAAGFWSVAMGYNSKAMTNYSTAIGYGASTTGGYALSLGYNTKATSFASTAIGNEAEATGYNTISLGYGNVAQSYAETALGTFGTIGAGDPINYNSSNRLLNVGRGTGDFFRSDAFTILKNGNSSFNDSTPSSTLEINGTFATATHVGGTNFMPANSAFSIYIYTSTSNLVQLPAATNCRNRRYRIVNKAPTTIIIDIYKDLSNINDTSLPSGKYIEIVSDGTLWHQIAGN